MTEAERQNIVNSAQIGAVLHDICISIVAFEEVVDEDHPYRLENMLDILYGIRSITSLLPDTHSVRSAKSAVQCGIDRLQSL